MARGQARPGHDQLPEGRERLHRRADRPPGRAARADLRGDQGAHPGERPVRPGAQGRLVALLKDGRGQAVRGALPARGPARRGAPADGRGRQAAGRRGGAARRQRAGGRPRVLQPRHVPDQPGPALAGLLHRLRRQRAVHAADQGPGHRGHAAGRDPGHLRRLRMVPGRLHRVLHDGGRRLAAVPGLAAPDRHPRRRRHHGVRGTGRALPRLGEPDPQRELRHDQEHERADQRGLAAGRRSPFG